MKSHHPTRMPPAPGTRIVVGGTTGSGKTTMARQLACQLGLRHVELDALHWEPGWREAPLDVFRQRVDAATSGDSWALDGNYSKVRDIYWPRADTIVWLDYPLRVVLWRLWWRTLRRVTTREELWNGNREDLRTALLSRDSILLWAVQTYERRRRQYTELLAAPESRHLTAIHLTSPRAARAWLASLGAGSTGT